jgi:hypothetical protein
MNDNDKAPPAPDSTREPATEPHRDGPQGAANSGGASPLANVVPLPGRALPAAAVKQKSGAPPPPSGAAPKVLASNRKAATVNPVITKMWAQNFEPEDLKRFDDVALAYKTTDHKGIETLVYDSLENLTVEELQTLHSLLSKVSLTAVQRDAKQWIEGMIETRKDPAWQKEQQRKLEEREAAQKQREERLLAGGMANLGGEGETWAQRLPEIEKWFESLKAAEATVTWHEVFSTNRISARQIGVKATNMGGTFSVKNKHAPRDLGRERMIKLDRGAGGIEARTNPANIYDHETGARNKNDKGLHDLSATLLDHERAIDAQLKPYANSVVVFMPVPAEKDLQILNAVAHLKDRDLKRYREIKSRIARVKLAQGSDMHTSPVDVSSAATDPAKIRYGVTGRTQRGPDQPEVRADAIDIRTRKTNALEHSTILGAGARQKVNEIVMAYRAHESKLFPLFAKWIPEKEHYRVVKRVGTGEQESWLDTKSYITRNGKWVDEG